MLRPLLRQSSGCARSDVSFSSGRTQGGNLFSRGQIHKILTNPVYRGLICHKDKEFPGAHPAIIDDNLWTSVQTQLQSARTRRRGGGRSGSPAEAAALKGLFRDETGDLLTPTHTVRRGQHHRYYISNRLVSGGADPSGWRLPASSFEAAVASTVAEHLEVCASRHAINTIDDITIAVQAASVATVLASRIRSEGIRSAALYITSGRIARGTMSVDFDPVALANALSCQPRDLNPAILTISAPFSSRRRGVETRIVAGDARPDPDKVLIRTLADAHRWMADLRSGTPLGEIARREGRAKSYIRTRAPLSCLAPKIQTAILDGTLPPEITTKRLTAHLLPLDWSAQMQLLELWS